MVARLLVVDDDADTRELQASDLPERIRSAEQRRLDFAADDPESFVTLDEVEQRYLLRVLDATGGNKSHAARILGVDRKTLQRKLQRSNNGD